MHLEDRIPENNRDWWWFFGWWLQLQWYKGKNFWDLGYPPWLLICFFKLSNSSNKRGMVDQTVMRTKPNKTFAMIKNEMDEKAKKKSKIAAQVSPLSVHFTMIFWYLFRLQRWNILTNTGILPSALGKKMSSQI